MLSVESRREINGVFRCGSGLVECSVGAYKGWVSVVRGVLGFIWSGDGAGRGRERTQSTQTAKKDVAGGKPARLLPKIAELSENFAEQFRVSAITRGGILHLIHRAWRTWRYIEGRRKVLAYDTIHTPHGRVQA